MSKIKAEKGIVTYVMKAGEVFVKSNMLLAYANALVKRSKNVEETDKRGQGVELCVDDKYFFPIVVEKVEEVKE